ncbi:hypothetical protein SAMN02745121_08859 [Nannocystis exedens]|uniref:Uncharacterized protein n=1 Tax=Nannocystis exedens TaxID=54 RepID=A0A1I2IN47_9BACT|nr:hypothetical protein [Nannocystis exedens]SFF43832.1 hypothetical protein SAMN02745121_08859 [Nannocystis exedens]
MSGSISAQVRRILKGHSDRALIHAVDDAGLEYKIEVPLEAVRGIDLAASQVLVLSWSLQAVPRTTEPRQPSSQSNDTPSAVDRAFMELMTRPRSSTPLAGTATADPNTSARASQGLAELFGVNMSHESQGT